MTLTKMKLMNGPKKSTNLRHIIYSVHVHTYIYYMVSFTHGVIIFSVFFFTNRLRLVLINILMTCFFTAATMLLTRSFYNVDQILC